MWVANVLLTVVVTCTSLFINPCSNNNQELHFIHAISSSVERIDYRDAFTALEALRAKEGYVKVCFL
jgi:hypothetical protein